MKNFLPSVTRTFILFSAVWAATVMAEERPYSVPPVEAPELAAMGKYQVGVRSLRMVNPQQANLASIVKTGGKERNADRALQIEVWYPAKPAATGTPKAAYTARLPRGQGTASGREFTTLGAAVRDAVPINSERFPLVLVSHGFSGWGTFMTYLTENLASKGYVVVAIDHADQPFTDNASFGLSFGSVLIHRARDQQFVIEKMLTMAQDPADPIGLAIDPKAIGVIGYSMGGFGALATAGAGYDAASPTFKQLPPDLIAPLVSGQAEYIKTRPANVRALVLLAPWGGQVANRAWTAESLQSLKTPSLLMVGDQDDITDFKGGVSWIFDNLKGADRHMLVYQNARHSIGGNPSPPEAGDDFAARDYFDESVWRKDRIMAINQHFISAFLDLNLKGDSSRKKYLNLKPEKSNDASWPQAFGQGLPATYGSGSGASTNYWPGFQRRWAVGLEMHHKKIGE